MWVGLCAGFFGLFVCGLVVGFGVWFGLLPVFVCFGILIRCGCLICFSCSLFTVWVWGAGRAIWRMLIVWLLVDC